MLKGKIKKEIVNFMASNDTMVRLSNQTDTGQIDLREHLSANVAINSTGPGSWDNYSFILNPQKNNIISAFKNHLNAF